jgi:hypothetical protein
LSDQLSQVVSNLICILLLKIGFLQRPINYLIYDFVLTSLVNCTPPRWLHKEFEISSILIKTLHSCTLFSSLIAGITTAATAATAITRKKYEQLERRQTSLRQTKEYFML